MAGKAYKRARRDDPIWFALPDKDDNDVRFDCRDSVPAGLVLDLGAMGDIPMNQIKAQLDQFFEAALGEEQLAHFNAMIRDPECGIDLPMLIEVMTDLTEEYTSRENPTSAPSAPTSPRTESGGSLTGGVSPAVLTYSRSEPTAASA